MRIPVDYPTPAEERAIVARMADEPPEAARLLDPDDVVELQRTVRRVSIDEPTIDYAIRLVLATRDPAAHGLSTQVGLLDYGASPRASLGLVRSARAMALLRGRQQAVAQDVYDVAYDILNARLALSYRATAEGFTIDDVLVELLSTVPAPSPVTWGPPLRAAQAPAAVSPTPPPSTSPAGVGWQTRSAAPPSSGGDATQRFMAAAAQTDAAQPAAPVAAPPQPMQPRVAVVGASPAPTPTPPIVLPGDPPAAR
jgi:MoxR-like ATPase